MKLTEIVQPASQFMTDHDQIKRWLKRNTITNYTIHPTGVVDVDGDVQISAGGLTSIPVQFGRVIGNFRCIKNQLTSLVGCPYWVGGGFACFTNNIASLSGIHKLVKHIGQRFLSDENVTNILGLMLIDGLKDVVIDDGGPIDIIMDNHLSGKRDIHACQEDLIEAGFAAQAKL